MRSFAIAVFCATLLNAQVTAELQRFASRSPEIAVRNDSAIALTAFAVNMAAVDPDAAPFVFYRDAAVDNSAVPIHEREQYAVEVPAGYRSGRFVDLYRAPATVAGIFADGSVSGDPALLSRLLSRRGCMLQAVELTRDILSDAGSRNVPRRQIVEQFRQLEASLDHWYLPLEQKAGRSLNQSMIERLVNLPDVQFAPFPPTAFVELELAALNRRRTLLMESKPPLRSAR